MTKEDYIGRTLIALVDNPQNIRGKIGDAFIITSTGYDSDGITVHGKCQSGPESTQWSWCERGFDKKEWELVENDPIKITELEIKKEIGI